MSTNGEKIVLGSGKLYACLYTGSIPDDATIETEANLLGLIQGGATVTYKPSYYTAKDDLGLARKTILTEEEVTLKSGIMKWCGETLQRLVSTARVTENATKRTVKIGGVSNQDGNDYVIRFLHEDPEEGNIRVTIVGTNQSELQIAFVKDKETVIDAEFSAVPNDSDGTLLIFEEDIAGLINLTVTSIAGATTGKTKITILPGLVDGNSYVYKTAVSVTVPVFNDVCNVAGGFTVWNGTDDITATTGNKILVVEVDGDFKAQAAGEATVTSKA